MRIVCQKCSAAYAIDDKFVTPKGVRAQCPRCRHLQLVKRDDPQPETAAAAAEAPPNPFLSGAPSELFDLSSPAAATSPGMPPPGPGFGAGASAEAEAGGRELMDFSELGLPASSPGQGAASAPAPLGGAPRPFAPAPAAPASGAPMPYAPQGAAPAGASPFGSFGDDLFGPSGAQADLPPLGGGATGPAPVPAPAARAAFDAGQSEQAAAAAAEIKCKSCGKAIFDPFDQALEICDDCRNKPEPSSAAGQDGATGPTATVAAPVSRPSRGAASGHSGLTPPQPYKLQTGMIQPPGGGTGRGVVIGLLAAAVLGGAGFLIVKRPWVKRPPPLAKRDAGPSAPIEAVVGEWRLRYPELTGSASEYVAAGDEQLERDTTVGYARAEEAFQRALVLDSRNDRAIAGWALALSFGRFGQIEERTAKAAETMLSESERRSGEARAYVAHAHLMLATGGNFNDIKVLAERGLTSASDKDKALANLALGQAFLAKNQKFAADYFQKAADLDPKSKRAVLYQAQLFAQLGELKRAMELIDKRLGADPDQWEAADMLARWYLEAGEPQKAKKTYQAAVRGAKDARMQLTLAVLAYQHEGQAAAAAKALEGILGNEDALEPHEKATALAHLAAAKRVAGDLDGADAAAGRALEKRPGDLNAQVQRLLISIERGRPAEARAQLAPLSGRLGDASLELVFQGLVELLEGKAPEAQKLFVKAYETDKRRTDALLLAGAAAAKSHLEGKAYELALKQGLAADPWRGGPLAVMAPVFVRPADLLRPARGLFLPLSRDVEDPNPQLAEGLVAWFSDDLEGAEKAFEKVTSFDPANGPGLAYRSFIALRRGQLAAADKLAFRAVKSDRDNALAHLAVGLTMLGNNKLEAAKKELGRAGQLAPAMLLPRAKIGEIEGRQKRPEEARKVLTTVLLNDPLYREARRAQYLGGS